MERINSLLVAIDLGPASVSLIQRVVRMYPEDLDKVHVVHVIRKNLNSDDLLESNRRRDPDAQREANNVTHRVFQLLQENGMACAFSNFHLEYGEPSFQIKRVAKQINADLVIVGSRSNTDEWMPLPGATTNCVIQGISSDVMAVKL